MVLIRITFILRMPLIGRFQKDLFTPQLSVCLQSVFLLETFKLSSHPIREKIPGGSLTPARHHSTQNMYPDLGIVLTGQEPH